MVGMIRSYERGGIGRLSRRLGNERVDKSVKVGKPAGGGGSVTTRPVLNGSRGPVDNVNGLRQGSFKKGENAPVVNEKGRGPAGRPLATRIEKIKTIQNEKKEGFNGKKKGPEGSNKKGR